MNRNSTLVDRQTRELEQSAQADHRLNRRWGVVIAGILVNACLGTVYSWSVFREPLELALGLTTSQSGLPYAVFLGVFAFSMPLAGVIMSRLGTRATLLLGGLLVGSGWIAAGLAPGNAALIVTYGFIGGAGVGLAYGVPLAVSGSWFPDRRGLAMGLTLAGFGVSPFLTAPVAELLILRMGVSSAMIILGIAFAVIVAAFSPLFRRAPDREPNHMARGDRGAPATDTAPASGIQIGPRQMLRRSSFYALWSCYAIGTLAGLTVIGMTASFGHAVVGLSAPSAAATVAGLGIANGLGRPVFGVIHDRLGVRRTVVISFLAIAAAAGLTLLAGPGFRVGYFAGFGLFWFMLGGWLAIAPAATSHLYGATHYVRNYGIMYTAYGVGALAGGGLSGALFSRFGSYDPLFVLLLALCGLGLVIALAGLRPSRDRPLLTA